MREAARRGQGVATLGRAFRYNGRREVVDAACVAVGRDPATLARSVGILVELPDVPPYPAGFPAWNYPPIRGSAEELAEHFRAFALGLHEPPGLGRPAYGRRARTPG